jgi:hypothetical protein
MPFAMDGIGRFHARRPTAKGQPQGGKIFMVRSLDSHQDRWRTQGFPQYPYVLFISGLLLRRMRLLRRFAYDQPSQNCQGDLARFL